MFQPTWFTAMTLKQVIAHTHLSRGEYARRSDAPPSPGRIEIPGQKEYASRAYKTSGLTIRTPNIEEQSYETLCYFLHGGTSRRL